LGINDSQLSSGGIFDTNKKVWKLRRNTSLLITNDNGDTYFPSASRFLGDNKPKHCSPMKIFHNCAETGENLNVFVTQGNWTLQYSSRKYNN
jgi:hypothetical protein